MSEIFDATKNAQARVAGQAGVTKPGIQAKTASAAFGAQSAAPAGDSGRVAERVALGMVLFVALVLAVSVAILSTNLSAMKKSLGRTDAAVSALALTTDTMRDSLKDTGAELVALKDDHTRTQEAVAGLERGFESFGSRQTELAGKVDRLESSLQEVAGRIQSAHDKPAGTTTPEAPQQPQPQQ